MIHHVIRLAVGLLLATSSIASAASFTWDPSKVTPAVAGTGGAFTADTIQSTNYVYAHQAALDNVPYDAFFLFDITGFSLNGVPIAPPGLGTNFGLYFLLTEVDIQSNGNALTQSGTLRLMLDPTHNNGTPITTINGITFANPAGVNDDITLATGSELAGSFQIVNGIASKLLTDTLDPTANESGFFVNPSSNMQVVLSNTNTPASRQFIIQPDGSGITVVNGAIGITRIAVPEPTSMLLLGTGLAALIRLRRRP